jgi:hypothetical protein
MAARHGEALRLRSLRDLLAHSATVRARLMDHRPQCDLWMMRGWIAGGLILWAAVAITGAVHLGSGLTEAALGAWLADLRGPVIVAALVAGLPVILCLLPRLRKI